tara:strand:- start:815 stop:1252 length:438 start_codon:yes stop_codon:yes gene_type:complete
MANIILCDIDGTVADNSHRQHFLEGKKDWDGFFDALDLDEPIYEIINKMNDEHNQGREIIFLTGRPERYRDPTENWLKQYFNFPLRVVMRPNDNKKNKLLTKKEMFEQNFNIDEIFYVIDNDEDLLNMWTDMQLKVVGVTDIISQ